MARKEAAMRIARSLYFAGSVSLAIAGYLITTYSPLEAQKAETVKVKANEIGGVVASDKGPEAGVWVIAETTDLPTRYIKEVVTDDRGRYLIPDLPKAKYTVWARGYGLVDSPKIETETGKRVDLKPQTAPDKKAAAKYYPANYWYAMMKVPAKNEFPGTGPSGNGISPNIKNQGQWLHLVKTDSCESCHQLGNEYTRTIPPLFRNFDSPAQAWQRRVQSGQAGNAMLGGLTQLGPQRATAEFGDWTSRIEHGELPAQAPPRPQGIERNVVITQWDWADPKAYLHDEIATDKRNPSVNANGLIYGSPEESRDYLPVLDPVHNTISQVKVPYRDPNTPGQPKPLQPSTFWGDEAIWDSHTTVHNPMFDRARAGLVHLADPRPRQPGVLQGGVEPGFGEAHAGRALGPATGGLRSGDQTDIDDRHLLRHASSALRRGRQQHAVDQQRRWRRSGGLAQHEDVGPDARRAEIAGLDGAGSGHQRQRQARRLRGRARSRS